MSMTASERGTEEPRVVSIVGLPIKLTLRYLTPRQCDTELARDP